MLLSERVEHSSLQSCKISPCGRYIANLLRNQLIVRDEGAKDVQRWQSTDDLREVHWSPDSELLLTTTAKTELVQVWRLNDPKWTATVDESIAGVTKVAWSPDSRHVLCFSDLQASPTGQRGSYKREFNAEILGSFKYLVIVDKTSLFYQVSQEQG
jgi:WD40 repeat protein